MTRPVNSLENLGNLINQSTSFDDSVINDLSSPTASFKAKEKAVSKLNNSVSFIIQALENEPYNAAEKRSTYLDYCRNLAAYLLVLNQKNSDYPKYFKIILDLLQNLTPTFKHDLRAINRQLKEEDSYISQIGYGWEDISSPFIIDKFANSFLRTEISIKEQPKVIIVEKPKEVEKIVEVERVVKVEKIVEVEKTDINDFGKEGHNIEFKSSIVNSCNDKPQIWNICKAVCAFLNADGGTLYIGVDDNGRAIPPTINGQSYGIHDDIRYLQSMNRMPYGKSTEDAYCLYVKRAIMNEFRNGNDVSKFDSCIIASETANSNVIKVEVAPSRFCIVTLRGIAYRRDGASSKEMDENQIEQRMFELYSVTPETHFRSILIKAINEKRQVILLAYASTNSATISDRYVEPVNFVCDGHSIACFDTENLDCRQFKLSRVSDIRILDTGWQYEEHHKASKADIFGWTNTGHYYDICLDMKLPAMTFLIEHHPNAKKDSFTKLNKDTWRLETTVHSLAPVRNFFLSFADITEIQETSSSEELKQLIRDYINETVLPKL